MTFGSILYSIIILPIESIIEFVFCFVLDKFDRFGVAGAIVAVSLAVNFLALPIYNMADEIQLKERELQKRMKHWVSHIKTHFKGDEQFMRLSIYYRQNNYHPLYAVRQSLSILIQIPFFMAAYNFLSHCSLLENQSILFLKDLSNPDALVKIGGIAINLLPILMTAINIASALVYTKGAPLREKIQTFALAVIFLALLYNSPSGLVFYWVLNQIFSLCKNIVKKMNRPEKVLYVIFCALLIFVSEYVFLCRTGSSKWTKLFLYVFTVLFCAWPFVKKCLVCRGKIIAWWERLSCKTKRAIKIAFVCFSMLLLLINGYYSVFRPGSSAAKKFVLFVFTMLFVLLPFYCKHLLKFFASSSRFLEADSKSSFGLLAASCAALAVLCGLLLPSSVIATDTKAFSFIGDVGSPTAYIWHSLVLFIGLFVFWPLAVYKLFGGNKKIKAMMPLLFFVLTICALANAYIFKYDYGTMDVTFNLDLNRDILNDNSFFFSILPLLFYLFIIFLSLIICKKNKENVMFFFVFAIVCAEFAISASKISEIKKQFFEYEKERKTASFAVSEPDFHFSRTEKNVIVLFLDRAISSFFPYIMEQFPEMEKSFDGFVYYPNCLSFANSTSNGTPAMMGGYDYTIDEINRRGEKLLKDKHNESILVLPKIFSDAGYTTTICRAPYIDYDSGTVPSMFDFTKMKGMNWNLVNMYTENFINLKCNPSGIYKGNIHFSIMQIIYPVIRKTFSNDTNWYFSRNNGVKSYNTENVDEVWKYNHFIYEYAQLFYLNDNIAFDSDKPTYTFISNGTTHEENFLRAPDYSIGNFDEDHPIAKTGKYPYSGNYDMKHYHVNVAAYLQVQKFLEKLKSEEVYDNTRIIIVADHGRNLRLPIFKDFSNPEEIAFLNPLLLFKDFDSHGIPKIDNTLKTNAETVYFATKDLPVSDRNPFTGNKIKTAQDFESFNVYVMREWRVSEYEGKTQFPLKRNNAYTVHDNIFDENNWTKVDTSEAEK